MTAMELFTASDSLAIPGGHADMEAIRRALGSFLEFHGVEFSEGPEGRYEFTTPVFVLSSRNKPLHRFRTGEIVLKELNSGEVEISFRARLSTANIIGSIASVVLGLAFAATMIVAGNTSLWWPLGAVVAGPAIAYTARDQCASRLKAALLQVASLSGRST